MKLIACALPLLAGVPSVLFAQVELSLPRFSSPAVRATLGPISVVATLGGKGVAVYAAPRGAGRAPPARVPRAAATASAANVLATAERHLGARYRYGGETPGAGFDCSGFVQYVFGRRGVDLPRTSREQAYAGRGVTDQVASLQPGDLMLFASTGARVDHVAIYAGDNRIIHSSSGAGGVVYDDLSSSRGKWFMARHVESRRVL
ncbi:MAG: C40 family peptidase [Gemmatimonadales bacterium]